MPFANTTTTAQPTIQIPTTLLFSNCYFSFQPSTTSSSDSHSNRNSISSHFSFETPCSTPGFSPIEPVSDPSNPLLATRFAPVHTPYTMDTANILQLQTQAAYSPQRSNSNSSGSSSSSTSSTAPPPCVRCSRCHQESMFGGTRGMVSFGTNLFYCKRCAAIVGYGG